MIYKYFILYFFFLFSLFAEDESGFQVDIDNSTYCTNCLPPTANAGFDKSYFLGSTCTLNGSLSSDPEGGDLTYQWTAPDGIDLDDPTTVSPSFVLPNDIIEDTYYTFTLVVNDGDFNSDPNSVVISSRILNTAPFIILDQSEYSVNRNAEFVIDASSSADETLHTLATDYVWTYDDSFQQQEIEDPSVLKLIAPDVSQNTSFDFTLKTTDEEGLFDEVDINVSVIANIIPVANLGNDVTVGKGGIFRVDGRGSYDPDGVDFVCSDNLNLDCDNLSDCTEVDCIDNPNIPEYVCSNDMQTPCTGIDDNLCVNPDNPEQETPCVENTEKFCSENIARACAEYEECQLSEDEYFCENPIYTDEESCEDETCPDGDACEWIKGYGNCIDNPYIIEKVCSDNQDDVCDVRSDCTSVLCIDKLSYEWNIPGSFYVIDVCSDNVNVPCGGDVDDSPPDNNLCESGSCLEGSLTDAEVSLRAPDTADDYQITMTVTDQSGLDDEYAQSAASITQDLFISEYAETQSSSDRYLEIYNGTSNNVNLSEYSLRITKDADPSDPDDIHTINLDANIDDSNNPNGFLASGNVLIVAKSLSGNDLLGDDYLDYPNNNIQFIDWNDGLNVMSGDGSVELLHNNVVIDVVGIVGSNPSSSGWEIETEANDGSTTKEKTLVRKDWVSDGTTVWNETSSGDVNVGTGCLEGGNLGCNQWDVYPRNTYEYGGSHVCGTCVSSITVTVRENEAPVAVAGDDFTVLAGSTIMLDATSSFDDDGDDLTYTWENEEQIVTISGSSSSTPSFLVPVDYSGVLTFILTISDGASWDPIDSNQLNYAPSVQDEILLTVVGVNTPPIIDIVASRMTYENNQSVEIDENISNVCRFDTSLSCTDNNECIGDAGTSWNGTECVGNTDLNEEECAADDNACIPAIYEDRKIYLDASDTFDPTSTGVLSYSWTSPEVDYNDDDKDDIVFSKSDIANPTFDTGEYYGQDRVFNIVLEVSDGIVSTQKTFPVALIARMPIIGVAEDDAAVNGYEGEFIRVQALSTSDPNGNINDLDFDWSVATLDKEGVCHNVSTGALQDKSGGSLQDASMYSEPQYCESSSDCTNGNCSEDKAVLYVKGKESIGSNTSFDIKVEVDDDQDDYTSDEAVINFSLIARYPVAIAGVDTLEVAGKKITLNGLNSHDPQELLATVSIWDGDDGYDSNPDDYTWEIAPNVGIIAFHDGERFKAKKVCSADRSKQCFEDVDCANLGLAGTCIDGYTFTWTAQDWECSDIESSGDFVTDDFECVNGEVISYWPSPSFIMKQTAPGLLDLPASQDSDDDGCGDYSETGALSPTDVTEAYKLAYEEIGFSLVITDHTYCGINCLNSLGPDDTGVDLVSSGNDDWESMDDAMNSSYDIVDIEVRQNCPPIAKAGKTIIYNKGTDNELRVYTENLRAHTGYEYQLNAKDSYDDSYYEDLAFSWESVEGLALYLNVCEDAPGTECVTDEDCLTGSCIQVDGVNSMFPVFMVPSDLCEIGTYTSEIDCCEGNNGVWMNDQTCSVGDEIVDYWTKEKVLTFNLVVNDGQHNSLVSTVNVTYSAYSSPDQPILNATGTHESGADNGTVNLFWDNISEDSIDDLTLYTDFQGYKIYRSDDYGNTWGQASKVVDGEILAWEPFIQFDLTEVQDSTYCLYKNDNKGCNEDLNEEATPQSITGNYQSAILRHTQNGIKGNVDWIDGYSWQNLGTLDSLTQTLIDTDVIDGVDYTYTITAYDRGIRPDSLQFGHFGKLDGSTWDYNAWVKDKALYTFHDTMKADTFNFYSRFGLNHKIIKSFVAGPDSDLNPYDENINPTVIINGEFVEENTHYYVIEPPEEWNVGEVDERVSQEQIDFGVPIGVEKNRLVSTTNPHGYPSKWSLESPLGTNVNDQNFVTIAADYFAPNISFEEDADKFISADCEAIGNGGKFYEIVNLDDLDQSLVRFEIEAYTGLGIQDGPDWTGTFEGYESENPCLFAYEVDAIASDIAPTEYVPSNTEDYLIQSGDLQTYCGDINGSGIVSFETYNNAYIPCLDQNDCLAVNYSEECIEGEPGCPYQDFDGCFIRGYCLEDATESCNADSQCFETCVISSYYVQINNQVQYNLPYDFSGLPGVVVSPEGIDPEVEDVTITLPDYVVDCHPIEYVDDPNYKGNWTSFFKGVRMRFDNALREDPSFIGASLKNIYSYPDSGLAIALTDESEFFGSLRLQYATGAFAKKAGYSYQVELFADTTYYNHGADTTLFNTTDLSDGPGEYSCDREFRGTMLPFRVKNLTTGKYVKMSHLDKGIWNAGKNNIPSEYNGVPVNENQFSTHPGARDCVWSAGEHLTFTADTVKIGIGQEAAIEKAEETFLLELAYTKNALRFNRSDLCFYISDYNESSTYGAGSCVWMEGAGWVTGSEVIPQDNYMPNGWYDLDSDGKNDNPWKQVFPWRDSTTIVLEPTKWFVDGDYWIADMSFLGQSRDITQADLDQIKVVPNPYIVSSAFNESPTSNRIRFTHLPQECKITIFTISGELVDVIHHGNPNNLYSDGFWDLRNEYGKKVAPGLYIYKVETNSGLSKIGKFAVVR